MKPVHKLVLMLVALAFASSGALNAADPQRQRDVARRGAQVMPFDLEQTLHQFQALEDGGVQRVIAKDPRNEAQIRLIRMHLKEEAARFARGDLTDPASIHGADMPGLATLSRNAARIAIRYAELPDGAEIRYTAKDPESLQAIHRWFQAQLDDHGRHATHHPSR